MSDPAPARGPAAAAWNGARVRRRFVSPELVSGIVLVSVVIAIADEAGGILDVFAVTVLSVLVFWVSDVFAHTVAAQRRRADDEPVDLRTSLATALRESHGYLLAAVVPVAFLLVGLLGPYDGRGAYWIALWVQVAVLAVVGWIAFGGRGMPWPQRVVGSLATAALGVLAVLLKILVH
ncbi:MULTISPECIES: hypothetical protein [unclassified Microbacterium]|uniref:hypothetical protein n=1 Tax=unclassified Microbacterium TaxID=2609290 RepID=UPI0025D9EFC2|nr:MULTISPECIES: hypothetical protein [unclassified Microbacterium]